MRPLIRGARIVTVFRVQDADGRGPFRPGMTVRWIDADDKPPTWMAEFGDDLIDRLGAAGEVFGSGVRTLASLERWFNGVERMRLADLGYRLVSVPGCRVLAESENQVVFGRVRPLSEGVQVRRWP